MLAIGCFFPLATLALGALVGSYLGAVQGGYWGAGIGFGIGLLVAIAGAVILDRARGRD